MMAYSAYFSGVVWSRWYPPDQLTSWNHLHRLGFWRRHFIRLLVRIITLQNTPSLYVSNICTAHYIRHWLMSLNTTNQMHAVWSWSLSVTCVLPFLSFPDRFVSDFLWVSNVAGSTEYKHSVHLPYRAQTFFLLDRHKENVAMYWSKFFYAFGNILDVLREHN